jgi:cell division protein FtsL
MSNLAKKIQQEQEQRTIQEPKKKILKKAWFSPGEKILGLVFGAVVCIGAVQIISNQADIYKVNKEIQVTQASIQEQQKVNSDLEVQVSELSMYERIKEKAEKLGLEFNENNVKVVQE